MIINLRYHIASLVATFLALGIGILIGSIMLGNDTLVKQQQQLTRKLELQIEELRKKNEAVQAIMNNLEVSNDLKEQFEKQSL
ncbi:MAG TPA: copper transporter, partial [Desulfotomaculum sp.]|nr:copper transporter [Desulfotomaculum sp.]